VFGCSFTGELNMSTDPVMLIAGAIRAAETTRKQALARGDAAKAEQQRAELEDLYRLADRTAPSSRDGVLWKLRYIVEFTDSIPDPAAARVGRYVRRVLGWLMHGKPRPEDGSALRRAIQFTAPLNEKARARLVDSIASVVEWFWSLRRMPTAETPSTADDGPARFTTGMLAAELKVSVRTIKRAIKSGIIVPTFRTASGRARYTGEYVECLKARADAARALGNKNVMQALSENGPPEKRAPRVSPSDFASQVAWKRLNLEPVRRT
jgi:hypothetical protein